MPKLRILPFAATGTDLDKSDGWVDIDVKDEPQDIWSITTPPKAEKKFGKHPTQKPVVLLERIILASTNPDDTILDPFTGSSTAGVAVVRNNRRFIGIDTENEYLELSKNISVC